MLSKVKQLFFLLMNAVFHFLPMKRQILFVCFEGRQYGDNPKWIAEYIHEVNPEVKLYWTVDNISKHNLIPKYLRKVKNNSLEYAWIKNRSRVIVSNGAGIMLTLLSGKKRFYRSFIKKRGQIEIATWHGTPLKHIGADIPGSMYSSENLFSSATVLISSSEYEKKIFENAFLKVIPVDLLGYARNDVLFSIKDKSMVKEKLGIPSNKRVLLYAPTYRDNSVEMSGIAQMRMMNHETILRVLSERFGGDWVLVYRFHNLVCRSELMRNFISEPNIINGNNSDDMADYLSVTDVLLTDYSGSLFDVIGTNTICFLFSPDLDDYERERGLYLKTENLPYDVAVSFDELIDRISNFDLNIYNQKVQAFADRIGSRNDGHSAQRVYEKYIQGFI